MEAQRMLLERMNINEVAVVNFEKRLTFNEKELDTMAKRIEQEYKDFANARRRWKSDFDKATQQAV